MKIVYSLNYQIDLGDHVFPTEKYGMIREKLLEEKLVNEGDFVFAPEASDEDILLVHDAAYLDKLKGGLLSRSEIIALELPYSEELLLASRYCVGGTITTARLAVEEGMALHLGGGFHHAFADHGEGFCVFNDVAVAVKTARRDKGIKKVLIVDLDLHQGNGTASIFSRDESVYTFSVHQENNYPAVKPPGNLDIGLPDGCSDREYLDVLRYHLPAVLDGFPPDLMFYLAGADPYKEDKLGGLNLSKEGLRERDRIIISEAVSRKIPLAVTLAGGYSSCLEDTVDIHCQTASLALSFRDGGKKIKETVLEEEKNERGKQES